MKREGNKIIFERKNCSCSWGNSEHAGKQCGYVPCPKCNGTQRTKGGKGKGRCTACYNGRNASWKPEHLQTCEKCNGQWQNAEEEHYTDYMPDGIWQSLDFKVFRHNRPISGNEALLGFNCVYSCEDYGRAWEENNDEKLLSEVKAAKNHSHQASKVCKPDGTLCKYVGIFVSRGGYSVRAVFDEIETAAQLLCERSKRDYMQEGSRTAAEGGNGTIDALFN